MTALLATPGRIGADPRQLDAFKRLCRELAKLNHPACPDMDWQQVEGLCLAVFRKNGIDLQTAVAFVLAHGHQRGVEGLVQGFALLEGLAGQWEQVWPMADGTRLEILDWLYRQVLVLLRGVAILPAGLSAVLQLQAQVHRLQGLLPTPVDSPQAGLRLLQQYLAGLLQQAERGRLSPPELLPTSPSAQAEQLMPVVVLPPAAVPSTIIAEVPRGKARITRWLGVAALLAVLAGWAWWSYWQAERHAVQRPPEAVRLDSLALFDAGSAELRGDASKALVNALVQIKAQPGWLIVITGHTDNSGDSTRNRELSRDRAAAVRAWIQAMSDIPDDCFAIRNAADSQPVASNHSELGRAANRRVDIHLLPQATECKA